jgi:hypothetical protein
LAQEGEEGVTGCNEPLLAGAQYGLFENNISSAQSMRKNARMPVEHGSEKGATMTFKPQEIIGTRARLRELFEEPSFGVALIRPLDCFS